MNRRVSFFTFAFLLLFGMLVFSCVKVVMIEALVPSVVNVSFREVGSTVWLDIVISHEPPPSIGSSHYVSAVQLEINDAVTDLAQTPQSSTTFTVEHNLGSNANTYSVRARALCNVHGYSAWSAITTYTSPSTTPTPVSTPSVEPTNPPDLLPQEALYAIAITVAGVAVVVAILMFRKKKK